ncbi:YbaN family protein [Sphingomonas sp. AOB5]|uniref:YbaN family protein n=1 Tax=Sphingomonas sp. AOB5 TaxID=3034017 RepID=UPI0023F6F84D|nr:YbaN family protein [Sphingomonas sp. AOB5]MDF7777307.1 YbaN family protein [Sphingomonas sp. AOB5]
MRRYLYLVAGFVSLGLAVIGAMLPVMPTTVFVILAAYCFARSSPRLEQKLLDHPTFGPHIVRWRTSGAISRKGKVAASWAFAFSIVIGLIFAPWPWSLAPIAAAGVIGGWIWTRPEG